MFFLFLTHFFKYNQTNRINSKQSYKNFQEINQFLFKYKFYLIQRHLILWSLATLLWFPISISVNFIRWFINSCIGYISTYFIHLSKIWTKNISLLKLAMNSVVYFLKGSVKRYSCQKNRKCCHWCREWCSKTTEAAPIGDL